MFPRSLHIPPPWQGPGHPVGVGKTIEIIPFVNCLPPPPPPPHLLPLPQVYDPSTAYLGAPVFYAPQAYAAIPGQFRFPGAKAHIGGRGLIRTPSVRGEDTFTFNVVFCFFLVHLDIKNQQNFNK